MKQNEVFVEISILGSPEHKKVFKKNPKSIEYAGEKLHNSTNFHNICKNI